MIKIGRQIKRLVAAIGLAKFTFMAYYFKAPMGILVDCYKNNNNLLKEFIKTNNRLQDYEEQIKKLKLELNILKEKHKEDIDDVQ